MGCFLDDLGKILMDFGCRLGWFLHGVLMVLERFWMDVGWICDGRWVEFRFCMFSCFSEFYDSFEVDCRLGRSVWQSSGKVWQGYGKTIAKLWQSFGKVSERNHGRVYGPGKAMAK